jgi:predicted ABC-type transport system involved in lysophospholipase L1 biosynthesis ATPase subunit
MVRVERGTTVAYVTHGPDFAAMAHRKIQLADGRVVGVSGP